MLGFQRVGLFGELVETWEAKTGERRSALRVRS